MFVLYSSTQARRQLHLKKARQVKLNASFVDNSVFDVLTDQCKKRKVALDNYDVLTHDGQPLDLNSTVDAVPQKIISLRTKKQQVLLWNGDLNITIDSAKDLMQGGRYWKKV